MCLFSDPEHTENTLTVSVRYVECWVILSIRGEAFLPHPSEATDRHTLAEVIDTCQHNVHTSLFTAQYRETRDVFVLLLLFGF